MTISGAAFGSLELVQWALVFVIALVLRRQWMKDGAEREKQERAELRSQRRRETTGGRRRALADFPGDDEIFERMPHDTGELRVLAETGDIQGIRNLNAAFFRTIGLREWTRKRAGAA